MASAAWLGSAATVARLTRSATCLSNTAACADPAVDDATATIALLAAQAHRWTKTRFTCLARYTRRGCALVSRATGQCNTAAIGATTVGDRSCIHVAAPAVNLAPTAVGGHAALGAHLLAAFGHALACVVHALVCDIDALTTIGETTLKPEDTAPIQWASITAVRHRPACVLSRGSGDGRLIGCTAQHKVGAERATQGFPAGHFPSLAGTCKVTRTLRFRSEPSVRCHFILTSGGGATTTFTKF